MANFGQITASHQHWFASVIRFLGLFRDYSFDSPPFVLLIHAR